MGLSFGELLDRGGDCHVYMVPNKRSQKITKYLLIFFLFLFFFFSYKWKIERERESGRGGDVCVAPNKRRQKTPNIY